MPTSPLRPCATAGCPALVPSGHCPQHARQRDKDRPQADARRHYKTARWLALRRLQLSAQPLCQACLPQQVTPASHVDHVIPHRGDLERFYDAANLQSLCPSCHSRKTQAGA